MKVIQLNVRIGNVVLRDQFQWDISNANNSPEDFAESLCSDLGLGAEFMLPIAHQIREQINEHQKLNNQERRGGGYQHLSAYGRDSKGPLNKPINMPGKDLGDIKDAKGRQLLNECELEQVRDQAFAEQSECFYPVKTMIRSLEELYQPQKEAVNKFFQASPMEEPF